MTEKAGSMCSGLLSPTRRKVAAWSTEVTCLTTARRPIRGNFHRFNKARIVTGPLPTFKTAAANHKEGELVEEQ